MTRGMDEDYIGSLSLMGGHGMGINLEGFGDKFKNLMLPGKYIDVVADKAVEILDGFADLLEAPVIANAMPHSVATDENSEEFGDEPSQNFEMEPAFSHTEGDQAVSSGDDQSKMTDESVMPGHTLTTEMHENYASRGSISVGETSGYEEEEVSSDNLEDSVKLQQYGAAVQDILYNSSGDMSNSADGTDGTDLNLHIVEDFFVADPQDDWKSDDGEDYQAVLASYCQSDNKSCKNKLLSSVISKLRLSKNKESNVHQDVRIGSDEAGNQGEGAASSSDELLESEWEIF